MLTIRNFSYRLVSGSPSMTSSSAATTRTDHNSDGTFTLHCLSCIEIFLYSCVNIFRLSLTCWHIPTVAWIQFYMRKCQKTLELDLPRLDQFIYLFTFLLFFYIYTLFPIETLFVKKIWSQKKELNREIFFLETQTDRFDIIFNEGASLWLQFLIHNQSWFIINQ